MIFVTGQSRLHPKIPVYFNKEWFNHDSEKQNKWRQSIVKEVSNMTTRKFWKEINKEEIPELTKPIGLKWVL